MLRRAIMRRILLASSLLLMASGPLQAHCWWSGRGYAEGGCLYSRTEACCAEIGGGEECCCTYHSYSCPDESGIVVYGDCC